MLYDDQRNVKNHIDHTTREEAFLVIAIIALAISVYITITTHIYIGLFGLILSLAFGFHYLKQLALLQKKYLKDIIRDGEFTIGKVTYRHRKNLHLTWIRIVLRDHNFRKHLVQFPILYGFKHHYKKNTGKSLSKNADIVVKYMKSNPSTAIIVPFSSIDEFKHYLANGGKYYYSITTSPSATPKSKTPTPGSARR